MCTIASGERKGRGAREMVDIETVQKDGPHTTSNALYGRALAWLRQLNAAVLASVVDASSQRRNLILWPFALILGLITYRILPFEPDAQALSVFCVLLLIALLALRGIRAARDLAQISALFGLGAVLLPVHGALFGTNMLEVPRYGTYQAKVDAVIFDDGVQQRWIVSDISGDQDWTVPDVRKARVLVRGDQAIAPGDRISARIRFYPVPAPAVPGGYDAQFVSHFDGIGAYGSVLGDLSVVPAHQSGVMDMVNAARRIIGARLVAQLGDRIGGIATALITGDQSRISEEDYDLMASAGIVHVISISGLHLTLVAGTMFASVRFLLSLSQGWSQRWPIKKIAAVAGIATAFSYMLLSGLVIPAVRSTIMLALVFTAIVAGRQALTMRNVAIAAIIIILVQPTSVFRASFQLSFAAVIALIAAYELARRGREDRDRPAQGKVITLMIDVGTTSIIAGLATLIFTAYHFQQTAPFGVIGNLMVMPVVSFLMMPAALLGTLLVPLGLEAPAYAVLGWSVEIMLWSAGVVRQMSGGFDPSPILAPSALVVALAALGWMAYCRDRIRLAGPILAVPLIAVFCLERAPDIFIADQSQALAVRNGADIALMAGRNNTFATTIWSERYMTSISDGHEGTRCDAIGCVLHTEHDYTIALVKDASAFAEDCGIAHIVVSRIYAPATCAATATLVIDGADLARYGTHVINWHGPDIAPTVRTGVDNPERRWRLGIQ